MFRILLVDDETMIKIGVRTLLENTAYTVVGTAANGVDALTFLAANLVDIVITDLKMPVMDGIELIHQLSAIQFEGVILVLSNYSDFESVREALTAGAADYILKTDMTRAKLLEHLGKISQNMRARQLQRVEETQQAIQQEQNAQKHLIANIEHALFTGSALSLDAQAFLETHRGGGMHLGMLLIDSPPTVTASQRPLVRQLQSILPDIFSNAGTFHIVQTQHKQILCLLFGVPSKDIPHNCARLILRQLEVYFKSKPVISLGVCGVSIQALRICYEQCRNALRYMFYLPDTNLFPVDKFATFSEDDAALYHKFLKATTGVFCAETLDPVVSEIRGFLCVCAQEFYDPAWVRNCCCRCSEHLLLSLHLAPDSDTISALLDRLRTAPTLSILQQTMLDELALLLPATAALSSGNSEVVAVLTFIDGHYMDKLSLEGVAEHVQLNKSYLCRLFKQETGMSIFHYINQVRMHKAAKMLASKSGSCSVADVAAAVGIDDAFYFTRKFKEFFHKTPREHMKTMADAP